MHARVVNDLPLSSQVLATTTRQTSTHLVASAKFPFFHNVVYSMGVCVNVERIGNSDPCSRL